MAYPKSTNPKWSKDELPPSLGIKPAANDPVPKEKSSLDGMQFAGDNFEEVMDSIEREISNLEGQMGGFAVDPGRFGPDNGLSNFQSRLDSHGDGLWGGDPRPLSNQFSEVPGLFDARRFLNTPNTAANVRANKRRSLSPADHWSNKEYMQMPELNDSGITEDPSKAQYSPNGNRYFTRADAFQTRAPIDYMRNLGIARQNLAGIGGLPTNQYAQPFSAGYSRNPYDTGKYQNPGRGMVSGLPTDDQRSAQSALGEYMKSLVGVFQPPSGTPPTSVPSPHQSSPFDYSRMGARPNGQMATYDDIRKTMVGSGRGLTAGGPSLAPNMSIMEATKPRSVTTTSLGPMPSRGGDEEITNNALGAWGDSLSSPYQKAIDQAHFGHGATREAPDSIVAGLRALAASRNPSTPSFSASGMFNGSSIPMGSAFAGGYSGGGTGGGGGGGEQGMRHNFLSRQLDSSWNPLPQLTKNNAPQSYAPTPSFSTSGMFKDQLTTAPQSRSVAAFSNPVSNKRDIYNQSGIVNNPQTWDSKRMMADQPSTVPYASAFSSTRPTIQQLASVKSGWSGEGNLDSWNSDQNNFSAVDLPTLDLSNYNSTKPQTPTPSEVVAPKSRGIAAPLASTPTGVNKPPNMNDYYAPGGGYKTPNGALPDQQYQLDPNYQPSIKSAMGIAPKGVAGLVNNVVAPVLGGGNPSFNPGAASVYGGGGGGGIASFGPGSYTGSATGQGGQGYVTGSTNLGNVGLGGSNVRSVNNSFGVTTNVDDSGKTYGGPGFF